MGDLILGADPSLIRASDMVSVVARSRLNRLKPGYYSGVRAFVLGDTRADFRHCMGFESKVETMGP